MCESPHMKRRRAMAALAQEARGLLVVEEGWMCVKNGRGGGL